MPSKVPPSEPPVDRPPDSEERAKAPGRPPPPPAEDRRSTDRVPAKLVVRFDSGPAFMRAYSGYTSNIGAGGLCLITRKSYGVGDALHLRIDVERETVELTGVVAWTRPGAAIGVRFDLVSEEQRKAVLNLVHRVTGIGV